MFKEFRTLDWAGVSVPLGVQKAHLEEELGIIFRAFGAGWRYDWQSDGMLLRVVRPDSKEVSFAYDALGRRTEKTYEGVATHFVWDGNVPLHEWQEISSDAEKTNITTWLFEQNTFIPAAKLAANGESFSIVSDYLGTPLQAFDNNGNKVWEQELDIFGRKRTGNNNSSFIPFKYQGQYEDIETGLYYNRFRYYDSRTGNYISQDPIGLAGGNPTFYGYVFNSNIELDILGLIIVYRALNGKQEEQALNNTSIQPKNSSANYSIQEHIDNGNLETQYISTTKRQEIAERYASPNPKRGKTESSTIIEIDTDKLNPKKVCDVSNGINPETGVPLNNPARKWARKDSEVLIHGDIPNDAYKIHKKGGNH